LRLLMAKPASCLPTYLAGEHCGIISALSRGYPVLVAPCGIGRLPHLILLPRLGGCAMRTRILFAYTLAALAAAWLFP
jgi:hypothetical protein